MNGAKVRLGDLREAASRYGKMKRAPRGAAGAIVKTTLIRQDGNWLCIETPFVQTDIEVIDGRFKKTAEVNPKVFSDRLESLKKVWSDIGGDDAGIWIGTERDGVFIEWKDLLGLRREVVPAKVRNTL